MNVDMIRNESIYILNRYLAMYDKGIDTFVPKNQSICFNKVMCFFLKALLEYFHAYKTLLINNFDRPMVPIVRAITELYANYYLIFLTHKDDNENKVKKATNYYNYGEIKRLLLDIKYSPRDSNVLRKQLEKFEFEQFKDPERKRFTFDSEKYYYDDWFNLFGIRSLTSLVYEAYASLGLKIYGDLSKLSHQSWFSISSFCSITDINAVSAEEYCKRMTTSILYVLFTIDKILKSFLSETENDIPVPESLEKDTEKFMNLVEQLFQHNAMLESAMSK